MRLGEKISDQRKHKIENSTTLVLPIMMREFRVNFRRMGSLSGLHFMLEACKAQEFKEATKEMYVKKDNGDTNVSMLCKFNLCIMEINQGKNLKKNQKEYLTEEEK